MADIPATVITVGGMPTSFLPLPTPWPSGQGCDANIYLHTPVGNPSTFLAWDPLFGAKMDFNARSCLPPQVSSWWSQPASETVYTALGPKFACPQAYSAVQTVLVATSLLQTFCCPSRYSLLVPQPNRPNAFPSQCISTVASGQLMTYLSNQAQTDAFTATITMNTTATVFAIPVNGFNFATTTSTSTSTTTGISTSTTSSSTQSTSTDASSSATAPAIATAQSTTPSQSSSTDPAAPASRSWAEMVGISVGVVFAALITAALVFLAWRRKQRANRPRPPGPDLAAVYYPNGWCGSVVPRDISSNQPGFAAGPPSSPKELTSLQYKIHELHTETISREDSRADR